jgi:hypothetical protein
MSTIGNTRIQDPTAKPHFPLLQVLLPLLDRRPVHVTVKGSEQTARDITAVVAVRIFHWTSPGISIL